VLLERLLSGDADVAVVSAPPDRPADTARFTLHHLLDEQLLVAMPRDHRLAGRRTLRLADCRRAVHRRLGDRRTR
jgi:DNA-binding transcriptional LysR family regulator